MHTRFIKFENADGHAVALNVQHIVSVTEYDEYSIIMTTDGEEHRTMMRREEVMQSVYNASRSDNE